jgi:hypothetical protein
MKLLDQVREALRVKRYALRTEECYVRLPFAGLGGKGWRLEDQLGPAVHDRDGNDLQARGLYLDAPPWSASVFSLKARA